MMLKDLTLYLLTYNVAGQSPSQNLSAMLGLSELPKEDDGSQRNLPDFFAIGLQEVSVKPQNLLYDLLFDDPWIEGFKTILSHYGYLKIRHVRLQGIVLLIFCKRSHFVHIRSVQTTYTRTGLGGTWGNKGGISARMSVYGCSVCFTTTHLAAHDQEINQRIQEYNTIVDKQNFDDPLTKTILSHDYVFWFGDLNFRIDDYEAEEILNLIGSDLNALLCKDQLKKVMNNGTAFSEFTESTPNFPPTYKYNFNQQDYNIQSRKPAWTDRMLYRYTSNAYEGVSLSLKQLSYQALPEYTLSDHKPVSSTFLISVFAQPDLQLVEFHPMSQWKVNCDGLVWYRFSEGGKALQWDWIGLYKADFMGVEEHVHYVWASNTPTVLTPDTQQPVQSQLNVQELMRDYNMSPRNENGDTRQWYKAVFMDQALLVPGRYRLLYIRGNCNDVLGMSQPFMVG